jgi:acyl-CoA thioesterase FadM
MKNESIVFKYLLTIKEKHLDTFGHVNNATYLEIFEEARWELITSRGYGITECHSLHIGPIVLGVDMKFKKELRNREDTVILTRCFDYVAKIAKIEQILLNSKGEEACVAVFTFGLFDLKERKLILPTPKWLHAIDMA